MTDWNAVSAFIANVVAWPGPNEPGYVNLHYSMPNPQPTPDKPLIKGMGWPFRDIDQFIKRAAWVRQNPGKFKDAWFCTSPAVAGRQERARQSKGDPTCSQRDQAEVDLDRLRREG